MKYVDEFRDPQKAKRCCAKSRSSSQGSISAAIARSHSWRYAAATRIQSSSSGRDHAARCGRARAWTWLPGMRAANGAGR